MRPLLPLIASAAAGVLFILAVPLTGLLDMSARPGSDAVINWYTQTVARQSIAMRSALTVPPDLSDPARTVRGASHYELVCASCHGSPAAPAARFAQDMSPTPPQLTYWRPDARLFYTVKYGIRHTAMPAWPSVIRDDEIWDMVAFLRRLPTMDAQTYAALAYGSAEPASCFACHGAEGQGRDNAFPRLDIQSPAYVADTLRAYRDGERQSGTMMAAARQMTDAQIEQLAVHFGRSLPLFAQGGNDLGAAIARAGMAARDIPACDSCHGDTARAAFPRLSGQPAWYLQTQLELFQQYGAERGGHYADIMSKVVEDKLEEGPHRLEPNEITAVSDFYGY